MPLPPAITYGSPEGKCNICGKYSFLTSDHVPPKGCDSARKLRLHHITQHLSPEDHVKGRIFQGGVNFKTICATCNNKLLGTDNDPALIRFAKNILALLKKRQHGEASVRVFPQKLLRSVLGHLCAVGVDRYEKGSITEPLRDYLLDYTQSLPSRLGVYFWPYPNGEQVIARDLAYTDLQQDAVFGIWLLKFQPVAFMVTWDEPDSHRFPVNSLTPWGDCPYDYEANIPVNLEVPHSHWPEAPTRSTFITGGLEAHMAEQA